MSLTITKWILCFFFCLVMLLLESNVICSHHIRYIHLKGFSSNVVCNEIVICSHHIGIYTLERFFFNVICNEIDCVNKNNLFILKKSVTASTSIDFSSRLYNLLIRAIRLNRNKRLYSLELKSILADAVTLFFRMSRLFLFTQSISLHITLKKNLSSVYIPM